MSKKNQNDYPIHFSEFDRPSTVTDTTVLPSRTHLMFVPSVEEMIARGYASETFSKLENAQFGDFSGSYDYEDVLNSAVETRERYEELPDEIKNMFRSPDELLQFVQNPANHSKAVALGILKFDPQTAPSQPKSEPETEPK